MSVRESRTNADGCARDGGDGDRLKLLVISE